MQKIRIQVRVGSDLAAAIDAARHPGEPRSSAAERLLRAGLAGGGDAAEGVALAAALADRSLRAAVTAYVAVAFGDQPKEEQRQRIEMMYARHRKAAEHAATGGDV